jgi:hypothetical protein
MAACLMETSSSHSRLPEPKIESQIVSLFEKMIMPEDIYDCNGVFEKVYNAGSI